MIGKIISHYKVVEKLGGGGMGIVYKAHDLKLDRFIALKFLRPHSGRDKDEKQRFVNEAKAVSALEHNNICTIFDIDETPEGQLFICMAYYEGETLEKKISRGKLTIDDGVDIAIKIARGLIRAHNCGIVHRDIKPSNVILTKYLEPKIVDFGLAKLTGHSSFARDEKFMGTVAYMSPEQANGRKVDRRTDIWSLGVVLYEMISGKFPFQAEYEQAIIYSILNEEPTPITELRSSIGTKLGWIVEKAIAKNIDERYQHMDEILVDLTAFKSDPESDSIIESLTLKKPVSSIAVLPFLDMSQEKDQEFFCDGIAEEIINALTRVPELRITSRTSSFQFKEKAQDIRGIGERLNVRMILEGSVRKAGDKLRISTQLIKVADGFQLWSKRFEREIQDVFAIQDEISESIVGTLKTTLKNEALFVSVKRYTENIDAYSLYLHGRYYWAKRTEEGLKKGIEYFKNAIKIEKNYALAFVGIADSYIMLGTYGNMKPADAMAAGKEAALSALKIDDSLAEAYVSLGCVAAIYEWDWKKAEKYFREAMELNPSYGTAHHWYAINCLTPQKRFDEAFAHIKRALDLDPLSLYINSAVGLQYYFSLQQDSAIERFQKTIDIDPHFGAVYLFLGQAYVDLARYEEARQAFQKAVDLHGETTNLLANIAYCYGKMGQTAKAKKYLNRLLDMADDTYVSAYDFAIIYAALGENAKAFKWLEKACDEHSYLLIYLNVDPKLDNLRSDKKYSRICSKIWPD